MSHEKRPTNRFDDENRDLPPREHDVAESEILINRIIDGEASATDHTRFERIADGQPAYWKTLALRQRDMANLSRAVDGRTYQAMKVSPGRSSGSESRRRLPYVGWALTATGWAAVLVLAVLWGVTVLDNQNHEQQLQSVQKRLPDLSPQEHLDSYVSAPNVYDQTHIFKVRPDVEQMRDGRWAMRFQRQIEEIRFYDTKEELLRDWDQLQPDVPPRNESEASEQATKSNRAADSDASDRSSASQRE